LKTSDKDRWDDQIAARTYRQLVTALEDQGLKEEAERFGYQTQIMQRNAQWWRIWQGFQGMAIAWVGRV
jgi:hypothetical protein